MVTLINVCSFVLLSVYLYLFVRLFLCVFISVPIIFHSWVRWSVLPLKPMTDYLTGTADTIAYLVVEQCHRDSTQKTLTGAFTMSLIASVGFNMRILNPLNYSLKAV